MENGRLADALAYAKEIADELGPRRTRVYTGQFATHVYVIGDDDLPTVKIGITSDPERRLSALRHQSGRPSLRVLFSRELGKHAKHVEREAHRRLVSLRVLGEWFEVDHETAIDLVRTVSRLRW